MKMLVLGCKTIKDGITTALIFFLTAISLILAGIFVVPDIWYLSSIIILSGIFVLLMVPLILIATYIKNK